jgi:putative ABC transport system ATP-binding protein
MYGGFLAVNGDIPVGALIIALGQAQFLIDPLGRLARTGPSLSAVRASARRIRDHLNERVANASEERIATDRSTQASSATSDLARQLLRRSAAAEGFIGIAANSDDLENKLVAALRSAMRAARQVGETMSALIDGPHSFVLRGTVRQVVELGGHSTSIDEPLDAAEMTEVLERLENGLDTDVGVDAGLLSGGQRSRLILARALHTQVGALYLVRPTTGLDSITELEVLTKVRRMRNGRCTVIFSRSPAVLSQCDTVIHFADNVVEEATHPALFRSSPTYRTTIGQL